MGEKNLQLKIRIKKMGRASCISTTAPTEWQRDTRCSQYIVLYMLTQEDSTKRAKRSLQEVCPRDRLRKRGRRSPSDSSKLYWWTCPLGNGSGRESYNVVSIKLKRKVSWMQTPKSATGDTPCKETIVPEIDLLEDAL